MRRATAGAFTLRPARAHALLRNLPALFVASLFATPAPATAQTMQDRARAAAEMSRAKTSDSEGLRTHFVTPGMSGQPIATVDGRTQFTPALACQKTASLLEILIQPSSSGDIGTVRIARDKDLDGRFDSNFNVPLPVSGICANGLISCAPGTWNQCKSLAWGLDAASDLTLRAVDMPALAGCYCINNSCGSNLVLGNLPSVLADLGGGIVGALTTADPRIGIAEARINGPVITYVGAQTTACTDAPALGQTQYRAAPTTIQSDASAAAATSRVFQTLAASPAGAGKAEQTRSCTTAREVTVTPFDYDDIVAVRGALQSVTNCGAGCRIYRIGGTGNCNNPPATYTAVFAAPKPDRLVSARIVNIQTADWLQARVNGVAVAYAGKRPWLTNGLPSGDCGVGDNYSATPNHDFAPALKAGAVAIDARIRATGAHKSGYLDVEIHVDTTCETAERLVDLCSGYRADPACRLADEDVDDVQTVRNGVATGLRPLPRSACSARALARCSCRATSSCAPAPINVRSTAARRPRPI